MRRSLAVLGLIMAVLVLATPADPKEADDALAFFRSHTITADTSRIRLTIEQLGDDFFPTRQQASHALTTLGGRALPALRLALRESNDPEVRNRAAVCINRITSTYETIPVIKAARTIAEHKPTGAALVLLDYYPQIADAAAANAVIDALAAVTMRDGHADPLIVRALTEEPSTRRAAAGLALCRVGCREHMDAVRKLLRDAEPEARLPIALTLIEDREKEAIPALISVLDQLPRTELAEAEELLFRLADEHSPGFPYGDTPEERLRFRQGWETWWRVHGAKVDPAKPPPVFLDRTLVVLLDLGRAIDLDSEDKIRFKIDNISFPLDAQSLPGDRVLVAEFNGNKVSERHRGGAVLWEKPFDGPLVAQRLPNGNTFMASKTQLAEVDRLGRELWVIPVPLGEEFMRASKLPDGDVAVVMMERARFRQRFVRLTPRGEERISFGVQVHTYGGRVDVQPDGKVLVPQMHQNRVVEFDSEGRIVREFQVIQPIAAVRLANGHTIATSMTDNKAVEFDAAGKLIWELEVDSLSVQRTRLTRCLRR